MKKLLMKLNLKESNSRIISKINLNKLYNHQNSKFSAIKTKSNHKISPVQIDEPKKTEKHERLEEQKKHKTKPTQEDGYESSSELKEATESFLDRINDIDSAEKDDIRSIEGFIKNFNSKIYKQNLELTNKIQDMFSDNSNNHVKLFSAINEVNKVNINNTSKLLKIFLEEILKQQKNQSNNKSSSSSNSFGIFSLIILLGGSFALYQLYNNFDKSTARLAAKVYDAFLKPEILSHEVDNVTLPLFEKLTIPTTLGNTAQVNNKNLILIGNRGIGKSESLKNYTLKELEKDNLVIYVDLRKGYKWDSILSEEDLIKEVLLKSTPKIETLKKISGLNEAQHSILAREFLSLIEGKSVQIVFDNFEVDEDFKLLTLIQQLNYKNIKTIIASNTLAKLQYALLNTNFNNYQIRQLSINESNFKKYLIDKVNKYVKIKLEKVTCDKFDQYNFTLFKEVVGTINFYQIYDYIDSNTTIKNYVDDHQNKLKQTLISIKNQNPDEFEYLAALLNDYKVNNGYQPISHLKNKNLRPNIDYLDKFEKLSWISLKDLSSFKVEDGSLLKEVEAIKLVK